VQLSEGMLPKGLHRLNAATTQNGIRRSLMKWLVCVTAAFCIFSLAPVLALFCRNCGVHLPDRSKFCNSCGAAQNADFSSAGRKARVPASTVQAPLSRKEIANQQFVKLLAPLEAYEPELRVSRSGSPQVRSTIQLTLLPGLGILKQKAAQRNLSFSRPQAKLLALFQERCSAILEWSTTLGYEREIVADKIGQLACLYEYLRLYLDEETLAAIGAIQEVYAKELENMNERIDNLNESAGFENPTVAYQLRQEEGSKGTNLFTFSLLIAGSAGKIGNRIQVFDRSHKLLGRLDFVHEESGIRRFSGKILRKAFESMDSRQVWVEYVVKSTFSTSWQNKKLRLFLVPCLKADAPGNFEYEAFYGTAPEFSRIRFLQSIGKF